MDQTIEQKKSIRFTPSAIMLIIAAIALVVGIVAPPVIRRSENRHISEDCVTASKILDAVKTAASDDSIGQQITTAGYATVTWTVAEKKGVITCTNSITDLQTAVQKAVGDAPRESKTLGTAVWTVTIYLNADGSGYIANGVWTGSVGGDDSELTKRSGGTPA